MELAPDFTPKNVKSGVFVLFKINGLCCECFEKK